MRLSMNLRESLATRNRLKPVQVGRPRMNLPRELSPVPLLWVVMPGSLLLAQSSFLLLRPYAHCLLDTLTLLLSYPEIQDSVYVCV